MSNYFGFMSMMILLLADCQQVTASEPGKQEHKGHRRTQAFSGAKERSAKEEELLARTRDQESHRKGEPKVYPTPDDNFNDDAFVQNMSAITIVAVGLSIDTSAEESSPYLTHQSHAAFKRHSEFYAGSKRPWPDEDSSQSKNISSRGSGYISSSSDSDSEDGCSHSAKIQDSKYYTQSICDMKMQDVDDDKSW